MQMTTVKHTPGQFAASDRKRNINTAKFISVLIEKGFYDFTIIKKDCYCVVKLNLLDATDFDYAHVYDDGTINFFTQYQFKFESRISLNKKAIWSDITQTR